MYIPHPRRRKLPLTRGLSLAIVLTLALSLLALLGRPAGTLASTLTAELSATTISAAPSAIGPGEQSTITVTLRNGGDSGANVNVAVPVPDQLVANSISAGGGRQGNAITWNNVQVAGGTSVALTFTVAQKNAVSGTTQINLIAAISSPDFGQFIRVTLLTLNPTGPSQGLSVQKTASQQVLAPGEKLTYTITVRNTTASSAIVGVADPLSEKLAYVAGTTTAGGTYTAATRTVSWSNITVDAGGSVSFSFQVEQAPSDVFVLTPVPVTNTAVVTANGDSFTASVTIALVLIGGPPAGPARDLAGSSKFASKTRLAPGEQFTYTIRLHNSGTADATVDVSDPLPRGVSYVADSASDDGVYTAGDRTLRWNDITVSAGEDENLTFEVTAASPGQRQVVTNEALISVGDQSFSRRATIVIGAGPPDGDVTPPRVTGLEIEANGQPQDVLTSQDVTLDIDATDDVGVRWMYITEWYLSASPRPARWELVRSSGWIPFQDNYPWRLGTGSGAHFVGVWVADGARNFLPLSRAAIDFASLVKPGETLPQGAMAPYLAHYEQGVDVSATLTSTAGDADLYVWFPGNGLGPDESSTEDTGVDSVTFNTEEAGTYLFLVYSHTAATYSLTITPAGGTQTSAAPAVAKPAQFTAEPILTQSGLDPLRTPFAPPQSVIYLPGMFR